MARIGGDENITSVRWCVEGVSLLIFYCGNDLSKEGMMDIQAYKVTSV